jgi:RNA polymerase sigma-70 factor (ECF subfamily)
MDNFSVEKELLERCQAGSMEAFDQLCQAIQTQLYGLVYSIMRDHDRTDEVLQETLIRIYRHFGGLHELDKFPGWAMRIAVNQCRSALNSSRSPLVFCELVEDGDMQPQSVVAAAQPPQSPRDAASSREIRSEIDEAINQLPERQRISILMYEIQDYSVKQIAAALDCSEGAVKFNLHEGRKKLRQLLESHFNKSVAGK